jgi:hypothetical protein
MRSEVIHLHPAGWEQDPEDEYHRLSTLDYCVAMVYTGYGLFFQLTDEQKPKVIPVLKRGLEITLSQCRQLCGVIEPHPDGGGGLCFHKKRDSTVEFHVQWLDGPEDEGKYPSFDDLEKRHFTSQALGNIDTWSVAPMTYGEKPEAHPSSLPKVAAFKATFIRGGMVFVMHHHHYANDVMGWAGELHQLAENCAAVWKSPENPEAYLPPWDPACLDLSRVTVPDPPEDQRVDGPPAPLRHPEHHRPNQWLLFHMRKSKAAALKALASPADGSYWISTYDACMALIWRTTTRHRAKLFPHDPKQTLLWGEAVDMRKRFHDPPVPPRIQGNVVMVALGSQSLLPQLTVEEVISEAPLTKLAWYVISLPLVRKHKKGQLLTPAQVHPTTNQRRNTRNHVRGPASHRSRPEQDGPLPAHRLVPAHEQLHDRLAGRATLRRRFRVRQAVRLPLSLRHGHARPDRGLPGAHERGARGRGRGE